MRATRLGIRPRTLLVGVLSASALVVSVTVAWVPAVATGAGSRRSRPTIGRTAVPRRLTSRFAVLSDARAASGTPDAIIGLSTRIGAMLPDQARLAATEQDGTQIWMLPGDSQACVVALSSVVTPLRAACEPLASFSASGIQDELVGADSSNVTLVGLVPNAYTRAVLMSSVGEPLSVVPIADNAYVTAAQMGDSVELSGLGVTALVRHAISDAVPAG
jgi:hypothetical protein